MSFDINIIEKTLNTKLVNNNIKAIDMVDDYKKISDLMERVNIALGRKHQYKVINNSTTNVTIPK